MGFIVELSLKENLKNKKIIRIDKHIEFKKFIQLVSNKFNCKIISLGLKSTKCNKTI